MAYPCSCAQPSGIPAGWDCSRSPSGVYLSTVGTTRARSRCLERLELLAGSAREDIDSIRRIAVAELKRAIGFERWCVPLIDPDTLIAHTGVAETDHIAELPRLQLNDASLREVNNGVALARNRERVGVLSAVTGGDLARSQRWRESLERHGTGDELRVVAADDRGCWARFDLWRDRDDRPFDEDDAQLVRDASRTLGSVVRRAVVGLRDVAEAAPLETGVLLVGADFRTRGGTPTIHAWFRALNPAGMPYAGGIPSFVWSAIGRLVAAEGGEDPKRPVRIRTRAGDGRWAIVEAARLDDAERTIAITVRPAPIDEILVLVCRAYGLTLRQGDLVRLVAQGNDTDAIAEQMLISRYTIQDHLKSIFDKLGVHSRLELLTRLLARAG